MEFLTKFIDNIHWGNALRREDAVKNLEQGVVEIVGPNGQHISNGLLLTDDGYFLTCGYYISDKMMCNIHIREDHMVEGFDVRPMYKRDHRSDLIIAKANIPEVIQTKVGCRCYKFYNNPLPGKMIPVNLFTRYDGITNVHPGVTDNSIKKSSAHGEPLDVITIDNTPIIPADAGGVVVSQDEVAIIGLLHSRRGVGQGNIIEMSQIINFMQRCMMK